MGDIVMLGNRERRSAASAVRERVGDAEILFFTGIRYERTYVTVEEPASPRKSGKSSPALRGRKRPA